MPPSGVPEPAAIPTKFDIQYADDNVVFAICDCSLDKKYSFYKVDREQAESLIRRIKHIKQMTWKQLANLPREKGLTKEIDGSDSYNMIHGQNTWGDKIVEQHYFHFRVEGVFRIFGYQHKHYFCITHIDRDGIIHGH